MHDLGRRAKLSNTNDQLVAPQRLYYRLAFHATHTNGVAAFLERMSANPDAQFGINNPPPFSSHHHHIMTTTLINHPQPTHQCLHRQRHPHPQRPQQWRLAMVMVPHQQHHHQTADMACERFIWPCHVDSNFQDDQHLWCQSPTMGQWQWHHHHHRCSQTTNNAHVARQPSPGE